MSAQVAVDEQDQLRGSERTNGEDYQARHYEIQPGQQRHLPECHSGAAHAEHSGDYVDGGPDAAETGDQERQNPEVRTVPARKCLRGEGSVREPSHVGSAAGPIETVAADKTVVKEQSTEGGHPETKGVETGERHIASANHQRDQIVCESE